MRALKLGCCPAQSRAGPSKRRRLDEVCLEQHPEHSRNVIQSWIAQGKVQINGRVVTKAGTPVPATAAVLVSAVVNKFVCRWELSQVRDTSHV